MNPAHAWSKTFYSRRLAVTMSFLPGWWAWGWNRYAMHRAGVGLGTAFRVAAGPFGLLVRPRARR